MSICKTKALYFEWIPYQNEAKRIGWDNTDSLGEDRLAYNFYTDDEEASETNSNTYRIQMSSGSRWKNACIKSLKFRRQIKNGTFFASRTTRDIVSDNVDIAAIDYDKGYVAGATSKCKNVQILKCISLKTVRR